MPTTLTRHPGAPTGTERNRYGETPPKVGMLVARRKVGPREGRRNGKVTNQSWRFFQAFLKAPRVVASMIPSSPFLERRVVESARLTPEAVVVELGSGTGGTTRALLRALGPGGRLIAIERTRAFVDALEQIGDRRLTVLHGCASSLEEALAAEGFERADAVISGIPFSTLPPPLARSIVAGVHRVLAPDGRFVAYQFSDRVADYVRPVLGQPHVDHVLRNVPPLKIFTWERSRSSVAA
jgi:phosphatidylethanolamine/phosphatidyl-N-methylethanolamine N-methyltransferase